ncbi:MAG TPA: methionine aminotransferase [Herpetosiphonaceae bacterium]
MRQRMAERIRDVGTSIFTEMSALAARHQAINLSQGFPDFAGPEFVKRAAVAAIDADLNQYAPSHGLRPLREAVARSWLRHHGRELDAEAEITVTSGATEALLAAVLAVVDPGDEVIVFEPFYDAYPPDVAMAGGTPRFVRLAEPDWALPLDELRATVTPRTRAILLNTPHNPVGKVFGRAELEAIAGLAREHDLLVISDEVYERLVFDGAAHVPIATLPGMWERTLTISSTGKTFSLTGWKVGYVVAAPELTAALRRVHQFMTFATATPFQSAMAAALDAGAAYERELLDFYTARRDELVAALRSAGFGVAPPAGTYFVMADIRPFGWDDDVAFCRYLTSEIGVAAIPPSAFYHDAHQTGMARFCFAKRPETIAAAADRLQRLRPAGGA